MTTNNFNESEKGKQVTDSLLSVNNFHKFKCVLAKLGMYKMIKRKKKIIDRQTHKYIRTRPDQMSDRLDVT